jgi:hypothetical protein
MEDPSGHPTVPQGERSQTNPRSQVQGAGARARLGVLGEYAGLIGVAGAALGGLIYVALTLSAYHAYSRLGVSPEEVGLNYAAALLRAGIAAVSLVGFFLACFLGALVFVWPSIAPSPAKKRARVRRGVALVLLILVASILGAATQAGGLFVAGAVVAAVAIGLAMAFWSNKQFDGFQSGERTTFSMTPGPEELFTRSNALVAACLLVGLSIGALGLQAHVDSIRMYEGRVPSKPFFGVPPPWDAHVVRVHWVRPPPASLQRIEPQQCLLYLGQANATSVFFDPRERHQRTLKAPTSSVLVEVLPNSNSCS